MDLRHPEHEKVSCPPVSATKAVDSSKTPKTRRDSGSSSSSDEEKKTKVSTTGQHSMQMSEAFKNLSMKEGSKTYSSSSSAHQEFKSFSSSGSSQFIGQKIESSFQSSSKSGVQVTKRVVTTTSSGSSKSSSTTKEEHFVTSSGGQHHEVRKVENWCGTKTPEQILEKEVVEEVVKKEIVPECHKEALEDKKKKKKSGKGDSSLIGKIKDKLKKSGTGSSRSSSESEDEK